MPSRTIFLGRLIGIYCILVALLFFAHKHATVQMVTALLQDSVMLFVFGSITVIAGLAMILGHNIWTGGALPIIVTIVGWATLLKGMLFLFVSPEVLSPLLLGKLQYERFFYVSAAFSMLVGICLLVLAWNKKDRSY